MTTEEPDQTVIGELITAAASAAPGAVPTVIARHGFARCAVLLTGEVFGRLSPPDPAADGVRIRIEVFAGHDDTDEGRHLEVFAFDKCAVRRESAVGVVADAVVTWEVTALVAELFGNRPASTTTVGWDFAPLWLADIEAKLALVRAGGLTPAELGELFDSRVSAVTPAAHAVRSAAGGGTESLEELAVRSGSDKWGHHHWYARHYDRHFRTLRDQPVRVLEIGVGGYADPDSGGASLRMWARYFRRGLVYGLDVHDKRGLCSPRVLTLRGDQGDPDLLAAIGREHGPFDIVIDDGSHRSEHVIASFQALFPYLREEGLYVVEDLQTSYWPSYGGDPDNRISTKTAVGYFKDLVDGLNYREWKSSEKEKSNYLTRWVAALTFYHNVVFVTKALNRENGWPVWARAPLRTEL